MRASTASCERGRKAGARAQDRARAGNSPASVGKVLRDPVWTTKMSTTPARNASFNGVVRAREEGRSPSAGPCASRKQSGERRQGPARSCLDDQDEHDTSKECELQRRRASAGGRQEPERRTVREPETVRRASARSCAI